MSDTSRFALPDDVEAAFARFAWSDAQSVVMAEPRLVLARLRRLLQYGATAEAERDLALLEADHPSPAVSVERLMLTLQRYGSAEECHEVVARLLKDGGLDGVAHVRALLVRAIAQHRLTTWQAALRDITEGLALIQSHDGETRMHIELLQTAATVDSWRGYHSQALLRLTLALADCALIGDVAIMGRLLGECGRVNLEIRRHAHALEFFKRQGEVSGDWLDAQSRVRHQCSMAQALIGLARYDEALGLSEAAEMSADALRLSYLASVARRDQALIHVRTSRFDEARRVLDRGFAALSDRKESFEHKALEIVEAELLAATGAENAVDSLSRMADALRADNLVAPEIEVRLLLGELLVRRGRNSDAYRSVTEALRRAKRSNLAILETKAREALARLDLSEELTEEDSRQISWKDTAAVDGYILLKRLGAGASATVYRAFDVEEAREVALKLISPSGPNESLDERTKYDTVRREYQSAARVRHHGFARVLSFGRSADGAIYSVQDYVPGPTLRDVMGEPGRDLATLVAMLRALSRSLAALHEAGVVHCDLTPANIICPTPTEPVIVDLGIAARARARADARGTVGYASPELREGEIVDGRADIYSLGAIAFQWLTGKAPQSCAEQDFLRRLRLTRADETLLNEAMAPVAFKKLITTMLARKAETRPSSASALSIALENIV